MKEIQKVTTEFQTQIEETLVKVFEGTPIVFGVIPSRDFGGNNMLKIWAACSDHNIHDVKGQKPQLVSLALWSDLELSPQHFGGSGGRSIYRKPNQEHPRERFLAQASEKIPFRKPKKDLKSITAAVERFFQRYIENLKKHRTELMHQDIVDYSFLS